MSQRPTSEHISIRSKKHLHSLFLWNFKSSFHGKGIEFQDFKPYGIWEDAKNIDWMRSSQSDTTIMRRYREEKEWNILCCIDIRESIEFDGGIKKQVYRDCISLLWEASLFSWESFWGILLWASDMYIPLSKKQENIPRLSMFDNYWYKSSSCDYSYLMNPIIPKSVVFIISEVLSPDLKKLQILSLKHDVIYVSIASSFENTLSWSMSSEFLKLMKRREYSL